MASEIELFRSKSVETVKKPSGSIISRCGKALASVKISPPPLRRESPSKSVVPTSSPQEELDTELTLWICQNQQYMLQLQTTGSSSSPDASPTSLSEPPIAQQAFNKSPSSSFITFFSPQSSSLPHPKSRKPSAHERTQLYRQNSHPYPPIIKSTNNISRMDIDNPFESSVSRNSYATVRALPVLHRLPLLTSATGSTLSFPRSMTSNLSSPLPYSSQTMPRKPSSIPSIKPISDSAGGLTRNLTVPHVAPSRRKSIIPDPENEFSALYSLDESGTEFILSGTLHQLVNSLTDERADTDFIEDFLYTYRYFTTPGQFLELLQKRYIYNAPLICSDEERAVFDEWRGPVQLRVINVLKKWIEEHFHDFEDPILLDRLRSFIFATISMQNPKWATSLEEIIHSQLICQMNSGERAIAVNGLDSLEVLCALLHQSGLIKSRKWHLKTFKNCFGGQEAVDWMILHMGLKSRQIVCNLGARLVTHELISCVSKDKNEFRDTEHSFYQFTTKAEEILAKVLPATPILPKNTIELNLANVAPKEIARQLTLIEFEIFKQIKLHELSGQAWNKNNGLESPNVKAIIDRFNTVGFWAATEILSQKHQTSRVAVLKKLIKIAHVCKNINNFNTMMEIVVGLNMGSVTRLTKVWGALDTKSKNRFDDVMLLTASSQNYKNYREALKTAPSPTLPYMALYLRDLTFIEDGNSNCIGAEMEINFLKMRMLAKVFKTISYYQTCDYIFTPVPQLQQYLFEGIPVLNDTELYKLSYKCKPARDSLKLSSSSIA